ncbi:MAG: hypothetical protein JOY75_22100 [Hyphomicrobiales bacterium]|nr:hypothetical protein [Hyphomicrobiales bacterium]
MDFHLPDKHRNTDVLASALAAGVDLDYGYIADDPIGEYDDFGTVAAPATVFIDLGNITS